MFKQTKLLLLLSLIVLVPILNGCMTAKKRLQRQAIDGNRSAQALLGESYLRGYFSKVDYAAAKRWAQAGAYANQPLALFVLAEIYRNGYGNTAPDRNLAMDYYQRALPQLRQLAARNNIHASYDLGLLYKSGIIVKQDYHKALYYFRRGILHNFAPAINQLGVCYHDGLGVKQNSERAKHYFLKAALDNFPPAQYNIALLYSEQKNLPPALKWLNSAVKAEYPPAITKQALWQQQGIIKIATKQDIINLYRYAALTGNREAQFELAKLLYAQNDLRNGVKWFLKAVERSYSPAMLKLAELHAAKKPLRSLILLNLAKNSGSKIPSNLINTLDQKTGMALIIAVTWGTRSNGELFLKSNSTMERIIRGYKAGIGQGSHDLFLKELKTSPEKFYLSCDWQLMINENLPITWAGEIFQYTPSELHSSPAFWLSYGTCANRAGHGAIAMYAAQHLIDLSNKLKPSPQRQTLLDLAAIIKCTALIILGYENDAYDLLFKHGQIKPTAGLINYINHWALPALKNRKKFIAATGLSGSKLATFKQLPVKVKFYNMDNKLSGTRASTIIQPELKKPVKASVN
jgi:TPR repeat protein